MEELIKVADFSKFGLAEDDGVKLRNQILEKIKLGNTVIIDFEGISFFATPFFNASVGYCIKKIGVAQFDELVKFINLSKLGESTYKHSRENAVRIIEKDIDTKMIGKITETTVEGE